jgi:hypothetical protein
LYILSSAPIGGSKIEKVAYMNLNPFAIACIVLITAMSPIADHTMFEELKSKTLSLFPHSSQDNISIFEIENNFSESLWQEKNGFFINQTIAIQTTHSHLNIETKYRLFFVLSNIIKI